jgi:hypothetical protein
MVLPEGGFVLFETEAPQPTPDIHDGVPICLLASNDHIGETTCLG